jgi:DNA-binding beta-propeller fold protein YncE
MSTLSIDLTRGCCVPGTARSVGLIVSVTLAVCGVTRAASAQDPVFPEQKGGQDTYGHYEVVRGWPRPLAALDGHEGWTWGAGQSVFAESPDRVFVLQRGELPVVERPPTRRLGEGGPSLSFPVFRLPIRDATVASPPAGGAAGAALSQDGLAAWQAAGGVLGVDARWEHCILVFDREGNLVEDWTQWDSMLARPHAIYISPYDPEKHVWIVDDFRHAIFKFTNDGSQLVQTIGTFGEPGDDEAHFNRPTFMAWQPDGSFYVADGYANTRVVKFDREGHYLLSWGKAGTPPSESRPGYMNNVHGIAVDAETGRVFVNDRQNHRVQIFDENGQYLDEWSFGAAPSDIHMFLITADRYLWAADRGTNKILKYALDGRFLYSFGTWGDFPGGLWGVHGMSVDQEGNFYVAEVDSGGAQKFRPRQDADPSYLVGLPVYSAWR